MLGHSAVSEFAVSEIQSGRVALINAGSVLVSGQDASFLYSRVLSADAGNYLINGSASEIIAGQIANSEWLILARRRGRR